MVIGVGILLLLLLLPPRERMYLVIDHTTDSLPASWTDSTDFLPRPFLLSNSVSLFLVLFMTFSVFLVLCVGP